MERLLSETAIAMWFSARAVSVGLPACASSRDAAASIGTESRSVRRLIGTVITCGPSACILLNSPGQYTAAAVSTRQHRLRGKQDVRRPLRQPAHVPRKPLFAVTDEDANWIVLARQPDLLGTLNTEQQVELD